MLYMTVGMMDIVRDQTEYALPDYATNSGTMLIVKNRNGAILHITGRIDDEDVGLVKLIDPAFAAFFCDGTGWFQIV